MLFETIQYSMICHETKIIIKIKIYEVSQKTTRVQQKINKKITIVTENKNIYMDNYMSKEVYVKSKSIILWLDSRSVLEKIFILNEFVDKNPRTIR